MPLHKTRNPAKRMKLKAKIQRMFRSGSVEADKSQNFSLGLDEAGSRSRSYSSTDSENGTKRGSSPTSRPRSGSALSPMTANELHDSVLSALGSDASDSSAGKVSLEKKVSSKQKPKGTIEYKVKDGDTLVKIGAHFDVTPSELIKINRLVSRTVFVGQTLFIPDPGHVPSDPPTPPSPPPPDTRPKVDVPLTSLKDGPMHSIPGHAVPVSAQSRTSATDGKITSPKSRLPAQSSQEETDRECMQRFVKGPARRVMEEAEDDNSSSNHEGIIIKGTLIVTPNAVMFDPDASDPAVVNSKDTSKFGMVVYMDEIKSVALFHDLSPRMFWRQPKEIRAHSPKPEPYRLLQRPAVEGHAEDLEEQDKPSSPDSRPAPDGASDSRPQPYGENISEDGQEGVKTGRMSEELEGMTEVMQEPSDSSPQQGRASEEVESTMTQSSMEVAHSPLVKQMSRSSELEVSEMALMPDSPDGIGETRDFGPHMGRSSSEIHRHTSSSLGRVSDSSPGDMAGRSFFAEAGDTASDNLGTPTQGFSPLHFTDRSPKSVLAHPKPVPGQRVMLLSQSPAQSNDLKSQKIPEDPEAAVSASQASTVEKIDFSHDSSTYDHISDQQNLSESINALAIDDSNGDLRERLSVPSSCETDQNDIDNDTSRMSSKSPHLLVNTKLGSDTLYDMDDTAKPSAATTATATGSASNSPLSTFSPLRAPAQQLSNIFNYTSNFIQKAYKNSAPTLSSLTSMDIGKGRTKSSPILPTFGGLQLKSGFTKEDMEKILGPDPKDYLHANDSPHFEQPPLYLQIRPGIKRNSDFRQPRAFDHRNHKLLEEYWLIVPREMGDKLYTFLMEWQPEMYGDQEETGEREKFFYDLKEVKGLIKPLKKTSSFRTEKSVSDDVSVDDKEEEKSWEILSKEEVYCAEKSQSLHKDDIIDESNLPELIGQTQFIEPYHILSLVRSLPRNMTVGYNWELTYATHKHGYSLQNLYQKMEEVDDSPVILFIRDTHKCIFGAFMSHLMKPSETFYGSGSTFLFTFYPEFRKFLWQGDNQFFMYGTKDSFAIGSGEGLFGLWLDGDLNKGRSHECSTFHNDILTKEEDFVIIDLEVWRFVDSSI